MANRAWMDARYFHVLVALRKQEQQQAQEAVAGSAAAPQEEG